MKKIGWEEKDLERLLIFDLERDKKDFFFGLEEGKSAIFCQCPSLSYWLCEKRRMVFFPGPLPQKEFCPMLTTTSGTSVWVPRQGCQARLWGRGCGPKGRCPLTLARSGRRERTRSGRRPRGNPGYLYGFALGIRTRNYGLGREHYCAASSRAICPGHQLVCWLESLSLSLSLSPLFESLVCSTYNIDIPRRKTLLKKRKKTDPQNCTFFPPRFLFSFPFLF